jgi:hypothetical protein
VSAPWCVEFKKDILFVVDDKILIGMGHHNGNRAILSLRDSLRFDAGLNLAIDNILNEFTDILGLDFLRLVIGILGVLLWVLDSEGRELRGIEIKISSVSTEHLGVDGDNIDNTPVLLGNRLKFFCELLTLFLGFGEYVRQRDAGLQ